jgi:hypothetical protein
MASLTRKVHEPIVIASLLNGFFPESFVWRGRRHDVRAVESCRTEVRRNWRGQVKRHYFRVRTEGAVFDLAQDVARNVWQIERIVGAD